MKKKYFLCQHEEDFIIIIVDKFVCRQHATRIRPSLITKDYPVTEVVNRGRQTEQTIRIGLKAAYEFRRRFAA